MKYSFNNNLEALYGIDYCVNRNQNIIKQNEVAEEQSYFDELYRIFLEHVTDEVRDDTLGIGDYRRKAEYVLSGTNALPDLTAFQDFFLKFQPLQEKVIADIQNDETLRRINLDSLKAFFGIDDADDIDVILSMFINNGFGVYNGSDNIILGVKYSPELGRYKVSERIADSIYHDFSYPHIRALLEDEGIQAKNGQTGYLEENIARVLEIIFASRVYGDEYIEKMLSAQDKMRLGQVRVFLSVFLENRPRITTLKDYTDLLLETGLISK